MFPFKSEAIADKGTTNPLRSADKKERTLFKSDWMYFKANNSVSQIGHRSSQTHVSLTIVLVGSVEMIGEVELYKARSKHRATAVPNSNEIVISI